MPSALRWLGLLSTAVAAVFGSREAPPTLDDLWGGQAAFHQVRSFVLNAPGFEAVDAATRVVVVNGSWVLFGRADSGPTKLCPSGVITTNVRVSTDQGATWSQPHPVAAPDLHTVCIYADGSGFYDHETATWHYLTQQLDANNAGGWTLSHFSLEGASPFGAWQPNPHNPVVKGGQLWSRICAGAGKHCPAGMVDEGTPEIVEKINGEFVVTFHGYDYKTRAAARGVARTADFVTWNVIGEGLPNDAIFSSLDCNDWNVSWAKGGCIGSGEASVLRAPSGYLYQVIEAADVALTCDLQLNQQWWPLGMVRAKTWAASPQWEQMTQTPFVGGPFGNEPHVGCSIQYNALWQDGLNGSTFFAFWDVAFFPANASEPRQTWHVYELEWAADAHYPMRWPGPPESNGTIDCSTRDTCKATCAGFVECPADHVFYCCADKEQCSGTHNCAGTSGLHYCACDVAQESGKPSLQSHL
eukprot:m.83830 g.83830  ORF g.83830 m.83830 type:complete len:470 (+) comp11244_c0_seq2:30-1439(+)